MTASPAYQLLDLGEITLPGAASGQQSDTMIRVWHSAATNPLPVPTPYVTIDSLLLQPLDGPAGVIPRRLGVASGIGIGGPIVPKIDLNAITGNQLLIDNFFTNPAIFGDAPHHGVLPRVGASTTRLDLIGGQRVSVFTGQEDPLVRAGLAFASVGLSYQPRFAFMKGI